MNPTHLTVTWRRAGRLLLAAAAVLLLSSPAPAAKNVILMISDGAGENIWLAAAMYEGRAGTEPYDQPGWVRLSCSTYPLNLSHKPTGDAKQDRTLVYDPARAWDAAPRDAKPGDFAAYAWLTATPTDSAAAATALATGRKTYNNAINWSNGNRPMRGLTIAETAHAAGKSAGVITTVQWSDATPAGLGGAHNVNRSNHAEIANEMLDGGWLDVIMGAGNPDFDDDGRPLPAGHKRDYQWVGGQKTWESLKSGKRPWRLLESKADFEALVSGPTPPKAVGTAQVGNTFQEQRGRDRLAVADHRFAAVPAAARGAPGADVPSAAKLPHNANVPTLATLSRAAINCLDKNPKGFYLMIEGGAVDWANHANQPERMIEEQIDFVEAVGAVVAWINSHGGWDETLLILTADHDCGLLWGPDSKTAAFDPLVDRGKFKVPGMAYNSHGHSNSLVPVYARGPGSQWFADLVKGTDGQAAARWHVSGKYIDNTDVFTVMRRAVTGTLYWGIDGPGPLRPDESPR